MFDTLRKYIDNRLQLIKLELIGVLANVTAGLVSSFVLMSIASLIVVLFSFSLAFYLGGLVDSNAGGFAIVGGIYLLLFAIYLFLGKTSIDKMIKDKIVKSIFTPDDDIETGGDPYEEL